MKLIEISKKDFHSRLVDPRQEIVRRKLAEFRGRLKEFNFDLIVNEQPYYEGVWSMKAIPNNPEKRKDVEHINLQDARVLYYTLFTRFELEHGLTIMRAEETMNSITWHIHFNNERK
jgi:hypothetical protein